MSIVCADGVFHLRTKRTSYVFEVFPSGQAVHLYWGRALREPSLNSRLSRTWRAFSPKPDFVTENFSLDLLPMEFPSWGHSDFRSPAIELEGVDGDPLLQIIFQGCRICPGKPGLSGLPATYVEDESEAQTLEIDFLDSKTGLLLTLQYTVYEELDAITRSVRVQNQGTANIVIRRLLSMSVDLPQADLDWLQLSGAWARERHPWRQPLRPGIQSVESRRGASSHQQNPFAALLSRDATEERGDVYGVNLVYSGNFLAQAEVDSFSNTRLQIGINPFHFSWKLSAGESFQTPEAVMVFSDEGLGGMSRIFHRLYRSRLCRGKWRDRSRPILLNNWEATYFDFNEEKILDIARGASELGMELFVLDDGWFGKRNDDKSSLGDWFVNKEKLPGGLESLVEKVTAGGMLFGLWFEPEMVSPDSELYRQHPSWCLHMPDRPRTKARSQLVLDLSRAEVREAVVKMVSDVLRSAPISYVKWDMNRHMSEVGSAHLPGDRQKETAHRYMLGLYEILEKLTADFPVVLFESCSGGGGRFDPGMLYYMPQTWTSDNSDAISRLRIQYGTSLVYPISSIGAHVSAVPNHQTHRVSSLATRGLVAMSGNFGYELDVALFTEEERNLAASQVNLYKEIRALVQTGDLFRLKNPFSGDEAAWIIVSPNRAEAVAFHFSMLCEANCPEPILRLAGLDPASRYRIDEEGPVLGGDQLMYAGLRLHGYSGDFQGRMWRLKKIE